MKRLTLAVLFLAGLAACGDDSGVGAPSALSPQITRVEFEIDYEVGAEPYTFSLLTLGSPWKLFETNVEAVYQNISPEVFVPSSLDEMQAFPADGIDEYDVKAIVAIADSNRDIPTTATTRSFYVIFLDGYYQVDGIRDEGVIAVSIGDTGIIAMFKPVYDAQNGASIVEQTALIHEFGHALGLVNKGLPLTSDHHDTQNGPHCLNPDCVMFWQNEGLNNILGFVARLIFDDGEVLFGAECMADIDAVTGRP